VGTGDEFLDKLLSQDPAGLDEEDDEGAVPDLKVMDADINMTAGEVNASTLLDFFNQLSSSKSSSSLDTLPIKEEPLSEEDLRALQKDRQKKDNHNMSEFFPLLFFFVIHEPSQRVFAGGGAGILCYPVY
jgi:hypothetical protein